MEQQATNKPLDSTIEEVLHDLFVTKTIGREGGPYWTAITREVMKRTGQNVKAEFIGFSFCEDPEDKDEDIGEQRLLLVRYGETSLKYLITFGEFTEGYKGLHEYHDIEKTFHGGPMQLTPGKEAI